MSLTARGVRRDARFPALRHPSQVVVLAFAAAVAVGTLLLMLPVSRAGEGAAPPLVALFTATSAVCVTGLVTVDTPSYWSGFGEGVILGLIQVGGLGIMTLASLLGLLVARRMGLRSRMSTAAETRSLGLGDVRGVVLGVFRMTLFVEAVTAVLLAARFWLGYDESFPRAVYLGAFHAVSAFNNAGFALYPDNLMGFVADPWVCLPIATAVILGGLGFPVVLELRRRFMAPARWSLHAKMTVAMTAVLLLGGAVCVTAAEWDNPATLGALPPPARVLAGFFTAVMPRTAGFNSLDVGAMEEGTLLGTVVLMFVGGGSAGTAGGIKVTTFLILFFVMLAEVRGREEVTAFDRRIGQRVQRQALVIALLALGVVVTVTLAMVELTGLPVLPVLVEVTSAFGTVGLSTGITGDLPASAQLLLVGVMFLGRLGPVTVASSLALRQRQPHYQLPEGRPIVG